MPGFDELINTIINSNIKENIYGAAAIILEYYNEQLLRKCFELLERGLDIRKYKNMFEILGLKDPINRSSISGKSTNEILKDYERWKFISNEITKRFKKF